MEGADISGRGHRASAFTPGIGAPPVRRNHQRLVIDGCEVEVAMSIDAIHDIEGGALDDGGPGLAPPSG